MRLCPCQSGLFFNACCEPIISGGMLPDKPVQLMRSRFTAYVLNRLDYIEVTQAGPAKKSYEQINRNDTSITPWQSLEILEETDKTVTFKASYLTSEGQLADYVEKSLFKKLDGRWVYFKCVSHHG